MNTEKKIYASDCTGQKSHDGFKVLQHLVTQRGFYKVISRDAVQYRISICGAFY